MLRNAIFAVTKHSSHYLSQRWLAYWRICVTRPRWGAHTLTPLIWQPGPDAEKCHFRCHKALTNVRIICFVWQLYILNMLTANVVFVIWHWKWRKTCCGLSVVFKFSTRCFRKIWTCPENIWPCWPLIHPDLCRRYVVGLNLVSHMGYHQNYRLP